MFSISKSKWTRLLGPSSDIPTDITFRVYDEEDNFTEFLAHKYYLALVSKVLCKRFFGIFKESSDFLDVRGTTAKAFDSMIKCVYHKAINQPSTRTELFDIANLAEMYDVKELMTLVKTFMNKITTNINLKNVVKIAYIAERMSLFSFYSESWEVIINKCCDFLLLLLRIRVLDFSKLRYASKYLDTVQRLHEKMLELPLTACVKCP